MAAAMLRDRLANLASHLIDVIQRTFSHYLSWHARMFVLIVSQAEFNQYGAGERNVDTHGSVVGFFPRIGQKCFT
jgi:hypothetical protein